MVGIDTYHRRSMQVLIADPEIACYTGEHAALMVVAAVGLVVYVIGCGPPSGTF